MVIGIDQKSSSGLQEMLRSIRKGQEDLLQKGATEALSSQLTSAIPEQLSDASHGAPSSMMSQNFVSSTHEESKYLSAIKNSFAINTQIELSRAQVVAKAVSEVIAEAAFWYGDERMRNAKQLKDSVESNENNFNEIRDNIEEQASEAQVTGGSEAPTMEGAQSGNSAYVSDNHSQVDMPEISGSNPSSSSTSDLAPPPAPMPQATAPTAPVVPSIDITV